uniref:Secreted protein n=1 Tax=Knipowitschia caucasica TaxID=637954 RepID=A0AAV2L9F0_KNICA
MHSCCSPVAAVKMAGVCALRVARAGEGAAPAANHHSDGSQEEQAPTSARDGEVQPQPQRSEGEKGGRGRVRGGKETLALFPPSLLSTRLAESTIANL